MSWSQPMVGLAGVIGEFTLNTCRWYWGLSTSAHGAVNKTRPGPTRGLGEGAEGQGRGDVQ